MFDARQVVLMFSYHQVTLKFTQKLVSFLFLVSIYGINRYCHAVAHTKFEFLFSEDPHVAGLG